VSKQKDHYFGRVGGSKGSAESGGEEGVVYGG